MYEKELKIAIEAAKKAGKVLLKYHRKEFQISKKIGLDIVTSADIESENTIIKTMQKEFPKDGILAEESGEKGSKERKWIIDPLDGTHNFSRGTDIFGISIALEEKGEVVLGVISLPKTEELFYAIKGKGAFLNNKKINVSNTKGQGASIFFGGGWYIKDNKEIGLKIIQLARKYYSGFRMFGCAVYNCTSVAAGRAEAMVSYKYTPWDIAAGCLIIEEAGGIVTDTDGNKWTPYSEKFIAANAKIHNEILELLK